MSHEVLGIDIWWVTGNWSTTVMLKTLHKRYEAFVTDSPDAELVIELVRAAQVNV
jgi:hypothetical protein